MKMMAAEDASNWREIVDKHHSALLDELTARLDAEVTRASREAGERERASARQDLESVRAELTAASALALEKLRDELQAAHQTEADSAQAKSAARERELADRIAETLNQALRRMRTAADEAGTLQVLADAAGSLTSRAVVLTVKNHQARLVTANSAAPSVTFDVSNAGLIQSALETKDPIVGMVTASEIGSTLLEALSGDTSQGQKAYLFPIVMRHTVVGMLVAAGDVAAAPMELLSGIAGARLESLAAQPQAQPELVHIAVAPPEAAAPQRSREWADLSPEDQQQHLKAQRMARVRVAEMRLYHADALRQGVATANIYRELREEINAARAAFLQNFLAKSISMVDYLHLEILRSLAHEDDRLLGDEYPGPMV